MAQHHNYSITELENMIPFERDIFVALLKNYLDKLEVERKQKQTY
jgi:hypothetical protein